MNKNIQPRIGSVKLSVITINYNNKEGLVRTIQSVISQTCTEFEYIVVDGGSTDGSIDVINSYSNRIDKWVSEPDKGIYNAMNKGVIMAEGDYCLFLNSGDWLYSNSSISSIINLLDGNNDVITGNSYVTKNTKDYKNNLRLQHLLNPLKLTLYHLYHFTLSHESSFIRTSCLRKIPYDESLKICGDAKFFLELYLKPYSKFLSIDTPVSIMEDGGISTTNYELLCSERKKYITELLGDKVCKDLQILPYPYYSFFIKVPQTEVRFLSYLLKLNQLSYGIWLILRRIFPFKFTKALKECHQNHE